MACLHDPAVTDNQNAAGVVFTGEGSESGNGTLTKDETGPALYVKWQHGGSSMGGFLIQLWTLYG